jgi:hypothetical protein
MELVEAFLIANKKINQYTKRYADAKSKGIDKRIELTFQDVP